LQSIVKISLLKNADTFEFDVFFARLAPKQNMLNGMEVTVNWRSLDIDNKGVFYTDTNAFKIMRRDIN
jgi:hypothetical protein